MDSLEQDDEVVRRSDLRDGEGGGFREKKMRAMMTTMMMMKEDATAIPVCLCFRHHNHQPRLLLSISISAFLPSLI